MPSASHLTPALTQAPQDMTVAQVHDFLAALVQPVSGAECVPLMQALGRVLAQDVISPVSVPPHDNAAMDGFAFDGALLQPDQALTLDVAGTALAGAPWAGQVGGGQCVRIMTGAVMPAGLDTVVPQELVQHEGDRIHIPAHAVRSGDHRRRQGEDLMAGQPALRQGERLSPAALGLLASLGLAEVCVTRRLRVACFSTGSEILSLGEPPRAGAVYDSNRFALHGLLARLGVDVIDLGAVRDEPSLLRAAFERGAREADVVLTSGGVSGGDADHTRAIMGELGRVAFWRVAMRPGRPLAAGYLLKEKNAIQADLNRKVCSDNESERTLLFGLPGNPVAAMVAFLVFVRPALLRMMGARHDAAPPCLRARCEEALRKKPGRTEYQRGIVTRHADGRLTVRSTGHQGSGMLSSMVQANGLIVLPHEQGNVAAGEAVSVMMFDGVM
ncbi:molybdopterin molybdenumtransferase MoeA [Comamonadaceae bacterium OH2545_COT-014]|nr:molybdopterin molybdenumtransferase MoeA [Comamonadaceae bacterium OH2545_COT-014]